MKKNQVDNGVPLSIFFPSTVHIILLVKGYPTRQFSVSFSRILELCSISLKQIVESDDQHKLAGLLPARNDNVRYNFRNRRMFSLPRVKTKRFRNTSIMHYADKQQL